MIEFEANNLEELEEEARMKATEISIEILKGICDALDEGADVVSLGVLSSLDMDISIKKADFLSALTLNFGRVEKAEEFELCSRAIKWIETLNVEQE